MGEMTKLNGVSGYLALPEADPAPGILVLHAWWGLTPLFQEVCDRLAAAGYAAFAPDLYGEWKTADTIAEAEQLSSALNDQVALETATGALDALLAHPQVQPGRAGVIGFSLGAAFALFLAIDTRPAQTAAVVTFYGTAGPSAGEYARSAAAFQGHFAEADPYEPEEMVRQFEAEIKAAGRPVEFYFYPGTGHWFFEHNRPDAYNPAAAQLAWERTLAFLRQNLTAGSSG